MKGLLQTTLPLLGLMAAACSAEPGPAQADQISGITDVNPAPDVVEIRLAASRSRVVLQPGTPPADVWAYRDDTLAGSVGTIPGPLIDVNQGDRVIVHLRNDLDEDTTVHWHGVRVPSRSDGTPATQIAIPPGGTYTYEFVAEDAGSFWYHPHVRADVQIERGLYGMLTVRGGPEVGVDADRAFVLDDVKVEATGKLSEQTDTLDLMLGRQGNLILVNGRRNWA